MFGFRRILPQLWLMLIFAAMAPAQGRDLQSVGGPGGGSFREACPATKPVLNGVAVHSGSWVDSIQPMCVDQTDNEGLDFNLPAWNVGPVHGGRGGGNFTLGGCEKDRFMAALRIGITPDRFVNWIEVACRSNTGDEKKFCLSTGEGCTGPAVESRCDPGEAGSGIVGRSGTYLDAVGLMCERAPKPIKKTGSHPPSGPADPALCKSYSDGVAEAKKLSCAFLSSRPEFEQVADANRCQKLPASLVRTFSAQLNIAVNDCKKLQPTGDGSGQPLGPKIIQYAIGNLDRCVKADRQVLNGHCTALPRGQVGDGECTHLVQGALEQVGAKYGPDPYVWGNQVSQSPYSSSADIQPGDIIQLFNVELKGGNGSWSTDSQHTAIIETVNGGVLGVLEQNTWVDEVDRRYVTRGTINLNWTLTRGNFIVYRAQTNGGKRMLVRLRSASSGYRTITGPTRSPQDPARLNPNGVEPRRFNPGRFNRQ